MHAPELDAETIEAAAARVAAMNLSADKPSIAAELNAIREQTKDLPPLDASPDSKPSKPERKTITVDLTDEPETYAQIKELARDDDRTPAAWLRRYTVARYLAGHLKTPPAVTK
jgi:hypothetical protein